MTLKQRVQNYFFPIGSDQTIFWGYLKGHKIIITENSLWSPLKGGWEPTTQKIMMNVLKPGQIAYDLGANNGLHSLLLAKLVGMQGMVYNFEPLHNNLEEINHNFRLNGISNYINVPVAVSDKRGEVEFSIALHHKQGMITESNSDHKELIRVPTISLDEYISDGNPLPNFIKIDIEGAEGKALKGFEKNVELTYPDMVIELHNPEADAEVGQFLKFFKYQAFRFDPFRKLQFERIKNYDEVHPAQNGIWGTVFCISPSKDIESYSFTK